MKAATAVEQVDTARPITTAGVDFYSDEFIDDPYAAYAKLRRDAPVCRVDALNAWLLTRYKDVKAAALNDRQFGIDFERMQTNRMGPGVVSQPFYAFGREFIAFTDRPHHYDLKKFLMSAFTQSHAEALMPTMRGFANEAIDEFIADGRAEIMKQYAHEVPLRMISHILGVPPEDRRQMEYWVECYNPVIGFPPMTEEQLRKANEATDGFNGYFLKVLDERAERPGTDMVSQVLALNAKRERPFSPLQLVANLILLYFAGQDTQKGHFGNVLMALHNHPEQLAWLREDPSRVWGVTGELMRYDSVSQIIARVAMEDLEVAGVPITKGQTVLMSIGSTNRDADIFVDPDRFDLHRSDARLALTFGSGAHACLGTHFARLLIPIMLETILTRIPDLKIDFGGLVRNKTLSKRGYHTLPANW